jgi:hypothetical protein
MTTRESVIKNALPVDLYMSLISLILDYENETPNKLLAVLQDIIVLNNIPIYIPKHNIWSGPRPIQLYRMTPVTLRTTYINLIRIRTCCCCGTYPSLISYVLNNNVGINWHVLGCDYCKGYINESIKG